MAINKTKKMRVVGAIAELLIRNFSYPTIRSVVSAKYGISYHTVNKVIKHVLVKWQTQGEQDMRVKRRRAIEAHKAVASSAWRRDNLDLVLRAEAALMKIEGTEFAEDVVRDSTVEFDLHVRTTPEQEKSVEEFADDLEGTGSFERRMEKQLAEFSSKYVTS